MTSRHTDDSMPANHPEDMNGRRFGELSLGPRGARGSVPHAWADGGCPNVERASVEPYQAGAGAKVPEAAVGRVSGTGNG